MGATGVRIHGAPGAEQTPPNIGPTLASKNPRFMYLGTWCRIDLCTRYLTKKEAFHIMYKSLYFEWLSNLAIKVHTRLAPTSRFSSQVLPSSGAWPLLQAPGMWPSTGQRRASTGPSGLELACFVPRCKQINWPTLPEQPQTAPGHQGTRAPAPHPPPSLSFATFCDPVPLVPSADLPSIVHLPVYIANIPRAASPQLREDPHCRLPPVLAAARHGWIASEKAARRLTAPLTAHCSRGRHHVSQV